MGVQAMLTAATGMQAQDMRTDVIANNLSNVNTTAFKSQRAHFADLLYQEMTHVGATASSNTRLPTGLQVGVGVRVVGTNRDFSQGSLEQTNNHLDVAIDGTGFFQVVIDEEGTIAYTRDGSFHRNDQGELVTGNGHRLFPNFTVPETINNDGIGISEFGIVTGREPNQIVPSELGQIELARFVNPEGLLAIGQNLFMQTPASGEPIIGQPGIQGLGRLRQQYLEASNVDLIRQLVDMIRSQRAFEINSEAIRTTDDMMQTVGNLRR